MNHKTVALIGTWDTKKADYEFVAREIHQLGYRTLTIDVGVRGAESSAAGANRGTDISAVEIAAAGGGNLEDLARAGDRGKALDVMAAGAARLCRELYEDGRFNAILAMGGGGGTGIGSAAMRALPLGVPKLIVSTLASGDTSAFVDISDIVMMPAIVDVSGLNAISRGVYRRAAGAICGMLAATEPPDRATAAVSSAGHSTRKTVAVTMFGNTTRVVNRVRDLLEADGMDVVIFHATGTGGRTMEKLVSEGRFDGVLDVTTTEIADYVMGGVLSAGPDRLTAAGRAGLPQIIVPGCIDMCNFWEEHTLPSRYRERTRFKWNPTVTLLRSNPEENSRIAAFMADRINNAKGPVQVIIPGRGFSELDVEGEPFWWPEADEAFVSTIREQLRPEIPFRTLPHTINDPEFADALAESMIHILKNSTGS